MNGKGGGKAKALSPAITSEAILTSHAPPPICLKGRDSR